MKQDAGKSLQKLFWPFSIKLVGGVSYTSLEVLDDIASTADVTRS